MKIQQPDAGAGADICNLSARSDAGDGRMNEVAIGRFPEVVLQVQPAQGHTLVGAKNVG